MNISDDDNGLDDDLAMEVVEFFQLKISDTQAIKDEVLVGVSK